MRATIVFGPAYLDRVLRIDGPIEPGRRFDGSVDGMILETLGPPSLVDRAGRSISLEGIDSTSRPLGEVCVDCLLGDSDLLQDRSVHVVSDADDLGGMGAGFASALAGKLISALGPIGDPVGDRVAALLAEQGIDHEPIRVADRASDWSLIVSSGAFGDKLAIGFRGCHSAVVDLKIAAESQPCDLLVVASLPNRLIAQALARPARVRFLAPAMRNARDLSPSLESLAGRFDIMSLNRGEWEATPGRDAIRERTPIVVVTDGPRGCHVSFRDRDGSKCELEMPAFPRSSPLRDTNRAGEAFASTFVETLLDAGWTPGPVDPSLAREAALKGSVAASLVLGMERFGFPSAAEVQAALAW